MSTTASTGKPLISTQTWSNDPFAPTGLTIITSTLAVPSNCSCSAPAFLSASAFSNSSVKHCSRCLPASCTTSDDTLPRDHPGASGPVLASDNSAGNVPLFHSGNNLYSYSSRLCGDANCCSPLAHWLCLFSWGLHLAYWAYDIPNHLVSQSAGHVGPWLLPLRTNIQSFVSFWGSKNCAATSVKVLCNNAPSACGQTPLPRSQEKPFMPTFTGQLLPLPTACPASVDGTPVPSAPQYLVIGISSSTLNNETYLGRSSLGILRTTWAATFSKWDFIWNNFCLPFQLAAFALPSNCWSHRSKLPSSVWTSSPLNILSGGTELVAMASIWAAIISRSSPRLIALSTAESPRYQCCPCLVGPLCPFQSVVSRRNTPRIPEHEALDYSCRNHLS